MNENWMFSSQLTRSLKDFERTPTIFQCSEYPRFMHKKFMADLICKNYKVDDVIDAKSGDQCFRNRTSLAAHVANYTSRFAKRLEMLKKMTWHC